MSKINIMSLGGLNENGKNLYLVSVNDKILIFDCGMKYAPEKMYGVDYVIPDFTYWVEHKNDIVGKTIEIAYQAVSKNKNGGESLSFPVVKKIRDDK